MAETEKNLQLVESELPDDDLLYVVETDDYPKLLPSKLKYAVVQVKSVDEKSFPWGKRLVFKCKVHEPAEHEGLVLEMFVPIREKWGTKPPVVAKIKKLAVLFCRNGRFTKSAFLNHMFRARLKRVKCDAPYTKIDILEERLTGK